MFIVIIYIEEGRNYCVEIYLVSKNEKEKDLDIDYHIFFFFFFSYLFISN